MAGTQEKKSRDIARALLLAILAAELSACEVGGKAWITPVDHHTETSGFKRQPWKCYLVPCDSDKKEESGS